MAQPAASIGHEVVDLLSDSENELGLFDARSAAEFARDYLDLDDPPERFTEQLNANNDHEMIDLTRIPDIDVAPSDPVVVDAEVPQPSNAQSGDWGGDAKVLTETACLHMVLSVLPDISVDHVLKMIREKTTDATRTIAQCEHFLTELLEGEAYPKEADEAKNKKRKREDEADDELNTYEKGERDPKVGGYEYDASELLKEEFLNVPSRHITNLLKQQNTLYKAFGVLEHQVRNYRNARVYTRLGRPRNKRGIEFQLIEEGSQLPKELHAARKKSEAEAAKRRKIEEVKQAEEANLEQAQMNKQMGECACCFDDVPLNRMISCDGDHVHFYCMNCPRRQIETQMGQSRCRPRCFGVNDCNGTFSRRQLQEVLSEKTFERLEHMQQLEDLKAAGLDFLSECPFCDFKMECPPVDIDKEFRCQNTKCAKTSCRLCEKESHIPLSCEESNKDGQITLRHIVEEAIYVCSKNVADYNHFGEVQSGKCPLHENIEDRHEQEVKRAADEAMAKVRADNPGLGDADLMVKVSDRVKQAEDARKGRARAEAHAFPFHMVGGELNRRPLVIPGDRPAIPFPIAPPQPPAIRPVVQYVHPYPEVVPVPVFVQPFHPGYYGYGYAPPPPQPHPLPYVFHPPPVQLCLNCYLYHPPNQYC
ncbi:hypothetical protein EJ02DRAFT_443455 [Clathrospora elynae]|uniref:RING-type domain-containing protein n=1 Tax=Clathrospora elynae TaxID=706981 RepID=A0A6A5SU10_9PLEO|nr:hypothetical protein EJ02DRAFT_443455 [Clathrospora elynae]